MHRGASNGLTSGSLEITEITKIRRLAVVLFFFSFTATAEEPQESGLESNSRAAVLTFCSHLHQREISHISLKRTEVEKKGVGMEVETREFPFICKHPFKWTVIITAEEHVLRIRTLFEYKSSWGESLRAQSFRKIGHSVHAWPESVLHKE